MSAQDKDNLKKWLKGWQEASKIFESDKRRQLQAYNYQENKMIVDQMLQWACEHHQPRYKTGLVEQQLLFLKMREQGA